jgi:hypothetical protein
VASGLAENELRALRRDVEPRFDKLKALVRRLRAADVAPETPLQETHG